MGTIVKITFRSITVLTTSANLFIDIARNHLAKRGTADGYVEPIPSNALSWEQD